MEDELNEFEPVTLFTEDEEENLEVLFDQTNGLHGLEGIEYQMAQNRLAEQARNEDLETYLAVLAQSTKNWHRQLQ